MATTHERLWQLIAPYQEQLLLIVAVAYEIRLDGLRQESIFADCKDVRELCFGVREDADRRI